MRSFTQHVSTHVVQYSLLLLAILLYLGLLYFAPQSNAASPFGLSRTQIDFIRVSFALLYIFTWCLGAYGLVTLRTYIDSAAAKNTTNSEFITILKALHTCITWVIGGMIVASLIGGIRPYFAAQATIQNIISVVTTYVYIAPLLIGFWKMYKETRTLQKRSQTATDAIVKTLIVSVLVGLYVFLIFTNPMRDASYHMTDVLIILTIVVPIFATWWLGFSAAFALSDIIPRVTRRDFFTVLTRFLYGIWAIIFTSILLQAIQSLGSGRLLNIGVGMVLALVYLFIILQGVGYLSLVIGVRKLKKIKALP